MLDRNEFFGHLFFQTPQRQELQAPVEVRRRVSHLLPAQNTAGKTGQANTRILQTGIQIQVTVG